MELDGGGGCEQSARDSFMEKESGLELGLWLSLGGGAAAKECSGWCECEMKDFPTGFSSGRAGAGTKRERSADGGGGGGGGDEGCAAAAVSQVVGWPPIRAFRMNTLSKSSNVAEDKRVNANENDEKSKKKVNHGTEEKKDVKETRPQQLKGFVKVNMDGMPIGRKVDLNAHNGYGSLANTLGEMFFKPSLTTSGRNQLSIQPSKLLDGSSEFVLTYQDKDGDWMLVGDVPWRMFINTVKRLRVMRTCERLRLMD